MKALKGASMVALIVALFFTPYWAAAQCYQVGCRSFAQSAGTAIALDAHCSAVTGSAATLSCALTGVQAGDLITVETVDRNSELTQIADTVNGAWTTSTVVTYSATPINPAAVGMFYFTNSAAGNPTVTLTLSAAESANMSVEAWRNVATTSPLDTAFSPYNTVQSSSQTANPTCGSSVTPGSANELVIGYVLVNTTTPTAGTNFSLLDVTTNGGSSSYPEYWVQTTATATTVPFVNAADYWLEACAAFKHS